MTLGDADDVDAIAGSEAVDRYGLTDLCTVDVGAKLAHDAARLDAVLLEVPFESARQRTLANIAEAERDGVIAVMLFGLALHDRARTGFNDGNADGTAVLGEDARHAYFSSDDVFHKIPLLKTTVPGVSLLSFIANAKQSAGDLDRNRSSIPERPLRVKLREFPV